MQTSLSQFPGPVVECKSNLLFDRRSFAEDGTPGSGRAWRAGLAALKTRALEGRGLRARTGNPNHRGLPAVYRRKRRHHDLRQQLAIANHPDRRNWLSPIQPSFDHGNAAIALHNRDHVNAPARGTRRGQGFEVTAETHANSHLLSSLSTSNHRAVQSGILLTALMHTQRP